jgi:hypothetical protein
VRRAEAGRELIMAWYSVEGEAKPASGAGEMVLSQLLSKRPSTFLFLFSFPLGKP